MLYGPGGVGKGVTACWLLLRLVRGGHVPMVLDFEGHAREWGTRLRGLGATEAELGAIHYRAPFGDDWQAATGSLAAVADAVRLDCDRLGVSFVVVDSYSVATSGGDTMGGQAAAREYFTGLALIGLPSLTLAHVTGGAERWPPRPFGSVFVHNLARETWAAESLDTDEPEMDPDLFSIAPAVVRLELRNRKASARRIALPQFVAFEFFADGSISATEGRPADQPTIADRIAATMNGTPLQIRQIRDVIREDSGQAYSEGTLRKTLNRYPRRFTATGDHPQRWQLR